MKLAWFVFGWLVALFAGYVMFTRFGWIGLLVYVLLMAMEITVRNLLITGGWEKLMVRWQVWRIRRDLGR